MKHLSHAFMAADNLPAIISFLCKPLYRCVPNGMNDIRSYFKSEAATVACF